MKRLVLALVLAAASCSDGRYDNNDLQLATAYTAKELCSCVFVMEMPQDYCREWTRASPDVAKFKIDADRKTVETSALLQWGSRARFDSAKFGCVLDD